MMRLRNSTHETELAPDKIADDANRCELDDESISALMGFFSLLDKWDRESQEKVKESGVDNRNDDPQDSKIARENLGQNWVR